MHWGMGQLYHELHVLPVGVDGQALYMDTIFLVFVMEDDEESGLIENIFWHRRCWCFTIIH